MKVKKTKEFFTSRSNSEVNLNMNHERKVIIEDVITRAVEKIEPCIVKFSNGTVKNPENITGYLYRNNSTTRLGGLKERMLNVETPHLTYTGKNFGEDVVSDFKERFFLGVLNKDTNRMTLTEMSSFVVHPNLTASENPTKSKKLALTFKETQRELNEGFGGRRGRSFLRRKPDSELGVQYMYEAMGAALDNVQTTEMDTTMDTEYYDHILPPNNREASKAADVYSLEDILSDEELFLFNEDAMDWLEGLKTDSKCSQLFSQSLANTKFITDEELQAKLVCASLYMEQLINLMAMKHSQKVSLKNCPKLIERKILETFSVGKKRQRQKEDEDKLIAYVIVLALITNGLEIQWGALSNSLGVKADRLVNLIRVIGATPSRESGTVKLKLPLTKHKSGLGKQKKKKRL